MKEILQTIKISENFCKMNKLQINKEKSNIMILHSSRKTLTNKERNGGLFRTFEIIKLKD